MTEKAKPTIAALETLLNSEDDHKITINPDGSITTEPKLGSILWCCHVRGPDDVHAAPDYETALKWADLTNALNWRGKGGETAPPPSYDECLLKAVPAPWPYSAEAHAADMPKSIEGFAARAA
jgi:hypothetical protein